LTSLWIWIRILQSLPAKDGTTYHIYSTGNIQRPDKGTEAK